MYAAYFGLKREPFSIAPDPRYLFMSERHREALAHLLYGVNAGGGFVLLTGEIGAGKTTICRCFLEQIPRRCNVAYIFNPKLTVTELLKSVCDEFHVPYQHLGPGLATVKDYIDPLNQFLLKTHAVGQNNVLIIDEAQNLSAEVLEQLRLLTNLETSERKLLQIILIGQPELRTMLARPELEQLAQRVIARFHLQALSLEEARHYIQHRLTVAGLKSALPFSSRAIQRIHKLSRGIPRRINLLCDRAMLGAFAESASTIDERIVAKAASEVFDDAGLSSPIGADERTRTLPVWVWLLMISGALLTLTGLTLFLGNRPQAAAIATPAKPALAATSAAASSSQAQAASHGASAAAIQKSWFAHEREAWQALGTAWGLELGRGDPCTQAPAQQVQCFRGRGGLAQIRQLDRPSILTLQGEHGEQGYAILIGLGPEVVTLQVDQQMLTVSLAQLSGIWRGEFATLWRAPAGYRNKILPGQRGPAVDWLATRLAELDGHTAAPAGRPYGPELQSLVHAFQLSHGLQPDGIAGATTFMAINQASGVKEPRLTGATPPTNRR